MYKNQFSLLTKRRFLPLFLTQFLGAFNDNLYKTGIAVLITYILVNQFPFNADILVTLAGCLLILPMFLFSALAGSISDKFEKSRLIQIIKIAEIVLMILGGIGFLFKNVVLLMIVLFLLGTQATFFGPLKYSILPAHLEEDELISGNALVEMATFVAILIGNILGALLIRGSNGLMIISSIVIGTAILGYISSCFIPKALPGEPQLKISFNILKDTLRLISFAKKDTTIMLCILGISWFWLVGFIFITEFPGFTKAVVGGDETVLIFFLALFSIGIAIGSSLCNRLLKGEIEATFVPLAALGMSVFIFDLVMVSKTLSVPEGALLSIKTLFSSPHHWRLMADLLFISICGGIYTVPLYAMLQFRAQDKHKARIIAANNILNALFMSVGAITTIILLKMNLSILQILLIIGILNLAVVVQSCRLLPNALIKSLFRILLQAFYRVEVKGLEHFRTAGERVIITPNHTSFLDGLLLAAFLPGKLSFAVHCSYENKWWMSPVKLLIDIFFIEPTNPYFIKSLIKYVKEDRILVIFPEGRITVTGALMKIYEGPGLIADKADALVLPLLIEGAQYSPFSRLRGRVRLKWFPKISLTLFPAKKIDIPSSLTGRRRRQKMSEKIYQIMSTMTFLGTNIEKTLFQSLLDAKNVHGARYKIIEDINRAPLTYKKLILGSFVLGRRLSSLSQKGEAVGILLPNVNATIVCLFGLLAFHRVAALLNFSTGTHNVLLACETAQIKTVCTSCAFIENAKLQTMIDLLSEKGIRIIYLEDLKASISTKDRIKGVLTSWFPRLGGVYHTPAQAHLPAIILFTSGSEGTPKAVVLSSANIHANKAQLASRVDFTSNDIVLNALPIFHSFGLTAGSILPILYGLKVFFYPSPLHYRIIPELSYDINATIMFGTNTFLSGYARFANPYDFYSLRYVYAGAEKLKEENRRLWADKFGVRIFEGYGATETSPVISANTPMHNKPGSVGQFMPGIEYRIEPIEGLQNGGLLFVKGPNIMLGYMLHNNPGVIIPPKDGWYDTGDIVTIDEEGYVTIEGRAKRFAKIAGEMVSLTYIEGVVDKLWPHYQHAIISVPDEKKGEQLILFTTFEKADKSELLIHARAKGVSELAIPKTIIVVNSIPLLGTGKIDYQSVLNRLQESKGDS